MKLGVALRRRDSFIGQAALIVRAPALRHALISGRQLNTLAANSESAENRQTCEHQLHGSLRLFDGPPLGPCRV
ncbi:MAG: hypothetical protein ABL893_01155 [Hyphomicrobium sp.]